ncbi:MAG: ATP-binding protein, partial [Vallitaleaceae bacterium]|nr:ATP-binding protein [Vallitaleaceae bacterium]
MYLIVDVYYWKTGELMKELSMHILDLLTNSVRAAALEITIAIEENNKNNTFSFVIKDNGKGIAPSMLATIKDPFITSRTFRKVGLGLPLMDDTCRNCNGSLTIES